MSDPIPSTEEQQTNPEDRRAATALSSLNNDQSGSQLPSTTDQEALGKAMSRLEIAAGQSSASAGQTVRKAVKAEDVSLLVSELDLSKTKATELLKANDGDARKAIQAFIAGY